MDFPGNEPNPILGFVVRFICGALLGALLGLGWGAMGERPDGQTLLVLIGAAAFIFGLLAALFGDAFWKNFASWLWWWI